MLDTLKCIFEGRRELFRGLKIEKRRYDWKKYPVVLLDIRDVFKATSTNEIISTTGGADGRLKAVWTVLVYDGDLDPVVPAQGCFDAIVRFKKIAR